MKRLRMLCIIFAVLFLVGCNSTVEDRVIEEAVPELSVKVDGSAIPFVYDSAEWDNSLLYDRFDSFPKVLEGALEQVPVAQLNQEVQIAFENGQEPDECYMYSSLVKKDGSNLFSMETIEKLELEVSDGKGVFLIEPHMSLYFLSSPLEEYEKYGILHGYNLICKWGNQEYQYCFAIRSDYGGGSMGDMVKMESDIDSITVDLVNVSDLSGDSYYNFRVTNGSGREIEYMELSIGFEPTEASKAIGLTNDTVFNAVAQEPFDIEAGESLDFLVHIPRKIIIADAVDYNNVQVMVVGFFDEVEIENRFSFGGDLESFSLSEEKEQTEAKAEKATEVPEPNETYIYDVVHSYNELHVLASDIQAANFNIRCSSIAIQDTDSDIKTVIADDFPTLPVISPSGTAFAYIDVYEFEAVGDAHVYDLETQSDRKITRFFGMSGNTVKSIEWISDSRLLLIIGFDVGTITQGGDLYLFDIESNRLQLIRRPGDMREFVKVELQDDLLEITEVYWLDDNYSDYDYETYRVPLEQVVPGGF